MLKFDLVANGIGWNLAEKKTDDTIFKAPTFPTFLHFWQFILVAPKVKLDVKILKFTIHIARGS